MADESDIVKLLEEKKEVIDNCIKKYIPEKFDEKYLEWALGKPRYKYSVEALNKSIAEPVWDLLNRGGKRWRPVLFLLIAEALGGDPKKYLDLVVVPEVIHNGTLMVDDIEDQSETRRGKPCTHKIFGEDIAINAGNTMYYLPLLVLMKNKDKLSDKVLVKLYETYTQEMINVSSGQGTDIAWHKGIANSDNITEAEYMQMCAYKTGCLSRMSAKLGAIVAGAGDDTVEKIGKFAEAIGVAFQIQDDVLSASGEAFQKKKGYGDDITEGKRTLIVINTLKKAGEKDRKRLIEILNIHTRDEKLITEALGILKKYGGVDYAKGVAKEMVRNTWKEVDSILKPSDAKEKLKKFVDYLVERSI
ncbi:MAG: polyprenyl synthetase family protein [Candidatus Aenigmarchaeota archaeon]|nr:polyprenyl synthetase family protein [Candidatus Aenigmarchaeota archaeon]